MNQSKYTISPLTGGARLEVFGREQLIVGFPFPLRDAEDGTRGSVRDLFPPFVLQRRRAIQNPKQVGVLSFS
jgi:hypothetical protein